MHPVLLELLDELMEQTTTEPVEVGYDGSEYEGWYCINIRPMTCLGCGQPVCYAEPNLYHVIIVWEEKDDRYLLKIAAKLQEIGCEPRIVTYHPILGTCIPWEEARNLNENT